MRNLRTWTLLIVGGLGSIVAAFVGIAAPRRARRLAAEYARFRADFQATHDAIDAVYDHHERVVDGIRWHYIEAGAPDGEVILFLHGLPEGWYSWQYVLPQVDQSYRLVAIDLKGYGRSDLHDLDYDWHHVARQIADLIASLGIERYFVVAHDWGAIIGSVLVGDHPNRILGFVRMEADLVPREGTLGRLGAYLQKPQWLLFRNTWLATYLMRDPAWFIDRVYGSRMVTPLRQEDRDYLVYEFSRPGVAEMNPRYFRARNWDLDAAIGKICANRFPFPVLQLQADRDPAQPPSILADVATRCPNVQLEWITDAGHFDNFDQPAQVADAINRFVRSSPPSRRSRESLDPRPG
jgi:pimeloyl-ACP methyl ester carboxylesterase